MNPLPKMKQSRTIAALLALVFLYFFRFGSEKQILCLILAAIAGFFAIFDQLAIIRMRNPDARNPSPMMGLPIMLLTLVMILIPVLTVRQIVRHSGAEGNVSYAFKDDHAVVHQVYGADTQVTLADTAKEQPVTEISAMALMGRKELKEVVLPKKLEKICFAAFEGCHGLTEVTLPEGLLEIGTLAFLDCRNLARVTIPASVTEIDNTAFSRCASALVIVGDEGSFAEQFAREYGYAFEARKP